MHNVSANAPPTHPHTQTLWVTYLVWCVECWQQAAVRLKERLHTLNHSSITAWRYQQLCSRCCIWPAHTSTPRACASMLALSLQTDACNCKSTGGLGVCFLTTQDQTEHLSCTKPPSKQPNPPFAPCSLTCPRQAPPGRHRQQPPLGAVRALKTLACWCCG